MQDPQEPTVVSPLEALAERIAEAWDTSDTASYPQCREELEAIRSQPGADERAVDALATVLAAVVSEADLPEDVAGPQVETQYQQLIQQVTSAREILEHSTMPGVVTLTYMMEIKYRGSLIQSLAQRDPAAAAEQLQTVTELAKQLKRAEPELTETLDQLEQFSKGTDKLFRGTIAAIDGDPAACEVTLRDALTVLRPLADSGASTDIAAVVAALSTFAAGMVATAWGISRSRNGQFDDAIDNFREAERAFEEDLAGPPPIQAAAKAYSSLVRGTRATTEGERSVSLGKLAQAARHYRSAATAFRDGQAAFPSAFDAEGRLRKRLLMSSEQALSRSRTLYMAQAALWPRWSVLLHGVLFVLLWLGSTVGLLCASEAVDLGVPWWGATIASLVASAVALRFLPIREAILLLRRGPDRDMPTATDIDTAPPGAQAPRDTG